MCVHELNCIHKSFHFYSWTAWPLKMRPIGFPEILVLSNHSMLRNTPKEHRSKIKLSINI